MLKLRSIWLTILLFGSLAAISCVPASMPEELLVAYAKAKETYLRGLTPGLS